MGYSLNKLGSAGMMNRLQGIAVDGLGYLYAADSDYNQILKISLADGSAAATFGAGKGSWP
jgi:diaminopimelate epimerase